MVAKLRLCVNMVATHLQQMIQTKTCHTNKILTYMLTAHPKVLYQSIFTQIFYNFFMMSMWSKWFQNCFSTGEDGELPPPPPTIPEEDNISCSTQRSGIGGHDLGLTDTMSAGGGSISRANNNDSNRHHSSSLFSNNIMSTAGSILDNQQHLDSSSGSRNNQEQHNRNFRGHIVRLNSIEPNTVMFNTKVKVFKNW